MTLHRRRMLSSRLAAVPPVQVTHPALVALLARWQACAGARPMPDRDDLRFLNLKPWRGHLLLVEVIDHGRQFGTAPGTGSFAGAGPAIAQVVAARATLDDVYTRVTTQRCAAGMIVNAEKKSKDATLEVLALPLAGPDGLVAALLVAAYQPLANDADQRREREG